MKTTLKMHGGKYYLAKRIVALMTRHLHYVEAYFGGGSVLLEKNPTDKRFWAGDTGDNRGVSEVVNDKSRILTNFWSALQHRQLFDEMHRRLLCTPLSRWEWNDARAFIVATPLPATVVSIDHAIAFFILCRQSLAGRMDGFTSLTRTRTRCGVNGNLSEWLGAIDGLPAVHARLCQVVIENQPASDLIVREDDPWTLFYLDPPYYHDTRAGTDEYTNATTGEDNEMTEADHLVLLQLITSPDRKGKFMISGYDNQLYREFLSGWTKHTFNLPNNAAGGRRKRRMLECLWCNYDQTSETAQS